MRLNVVAIALLIGFASCGKAPDPATSAALTAKTVTAKCDNVGSSNGMFTTPRTLEHTSCSELQAKVLTVSPNKDATPPYYQWVVSSTDCPYVYN